MEFKYCMAILLATATISVTQEVEEGGLRFTLESNEISSRALPKVCTTKNTYACDGCDKIVYCDDQLEPILVGTCDSDIGLNCNVEDQNNPTCLPRPCYVQPPFNMSCNDIGVYPHPRDCTMYFICSESNGAEVNLVSCLSGFAFDPSTLRCSIKLNSTATCKPPVECSSAGVFPVAGNRRLYYKCTNAKDGYDVELRYCFGNLVFVDGRCVQPDFTPGLNKDGVCTKSGSFMMGDCKRYNQCSGSGWRPYAQSCAQGMLFDPKEQKCIPFSCPT